MRLIVAFCVFLFAALALARPDDKYTSKYDNINVDEILSNDKLLGGYVNCMLDKGKCTPDGKELKEHMAEAIGNDCAKCTEKQKDISDRVMEHLIKHKPEFWEALCSKYDPEKKYAAEIEKKYGK